MGFNRKTLITLLGIVLGGIVLWWLSAPEPPGPTNSGENNSSSVEQEVSRFELVETTGPGEVWELTAPYSSRSGNNLDLEKPYVVLREEGDTTVIITAEQGLYHLSDRTLTLTGDVRVRRIRENQVLKTEVLNWDQSKGTLDTEEAVRIESPGRILRAVGLWANLSEERVQFKSNVEVLSH